LVTDLQHWLDSGDHHWNLAKQAGIRLVPEFEIFRWNPATFGHRCRISVENSRFLLNWLGSGNLDSGKTGRNPADAGI
jgi:hypothetical protein